MSDPTTWHARPQPARPRQLGLREPGYGILTLVLVAAGHLAQGALAS